MHKRSPEKRVTLRQMRTANPKDPFGQGQGLGDNAQYVASDPRQTRALPRRSGGTWVRAGDARSDQRGRQRPAGRAARPRTALGHRGAPQGSTHRLQRQRDGRYYSQDPAPAAATAGHVRWCRAAAGPADAKFWHRGMAGNWSAWAANDDRSTPRVDDLVWCTSVHPSRKRPSWLPATNVENPRNTRDPALAKLDKPRSASSLKAVALPALNRVGGTPPRDGA